MTHCENCNCYLGTDQAIVKHLENEHCLTVRLGFSSHLAYCEECHKYLGGKSTCFNDSRKSLEKHLRKHHNVEMH